MAASVQGAGHQRASLPCQDAHRWQTLPQGLLIAAVTDGAGSAQCAEVGATIAAEAAVTTLADIETWPPQTATEPTISSLLKRALQCARDTVRAEAERLALTPRDLATTLIVAVIAETWIAVAQIGDGAVVVADAEGQFQSVTVPPIGEYANETLFLTSPDSLESAQVTVYHGSIARVALFTDGLQRLALKLPEGTPHVPFFAPLFRFVGDAADLALAQTQLQAFLTSPRLTDRADDDLTLLLACLETGNTTDSR